MSKNCQIIDEIKQCIPDVIAIYIFGSSGSQFESDESDIDIAILLENKLDKIELWNLSQEIAITLNKDIDLIDLLNASTVMKKEIIMTGECIYYSDKIKRDKFENIVMSEYLKLNEERAEIIQDIKYRGKVYE